MKKAISQKLIPVWGSHTPFILITEAEDHTAQVKTNLFLDGKQNANIWSLVKEAGRVGVEGADATADMSYKVFGDGHVEGVEATVVAAEKDSVKAYTVPVHGKGYKTWHEQGEKEVKSAAVEHKFSAKGKNNYATGETKTGSNTDGGSYIKSVRSIGS